MKREKEIFTDYIKKNGLKLTEQRRRIADVFLGTERHLSADELYDIVKKRHPDIGHATVFRTLKLLADSEIAKKIDFGDGITRYEHKYGHEYHGHLICVSCGKIIETPDPEIERLQKALCRRYRFSPQQYKMEISGLCERCRRKKEK